MNIMLPDPSQGRHRTNDPPLDLPKAASGILRFSPTTLQADATFAPVVQKRGQVPNIPIPSDQLSAMLREMQAHRAACR